MNFDRQLPSLLERFHQLEFEVEGHDGIDYEPFGEFWPAEENASWIRAWTRNEDLDGLGFRVFAQDGSGGVVAFWLVNQGASIGQQPVVFVGSEGQAGAVAVDLADYVALVAQGVGPCESIESGGTPCVCPEALRKFAEHHVGAPLRGSNEIVERARAKHPGFSKWLGGLCR